ncbi:hypothetical protein PWT90_10507 [Aphanocladium album]|nr:hypothetical protein PWT90_10507 [Aphanocladium album]
MASLPRRSSDVEAADSIVGRARRASISVINANPQLGIWQAAGTAIAQAPNLTELRDMDMGAGNITFNSQGHSARLAAVYEDTGRLALVRSNTRVVEKEDVREKKTAPVRVAETEAHDDDAVGLDAAAQDRETAAKSKEHHRHRHHLWHHSHGESHGKKADIGPTIMHGLAAFWKFFITPAGFLITIYCLNIVAWGAMLFFLLLKAAPAMNHPSADDNSSPRKIWLEIDSQILNALFCVTGFGLAPWRFRDLYLFVRGAHMRDRAAMAKLAKQNRGWFRPPTWYTDAERAAAESSDEVKAPTFTGRVAPPTPVWKLGFTIWMMGWATGTFIGLGCGVSMLAGLMSYWEGRKVKKIEGPAVEVVEGVEALVSALQARLLVHHHGLLFRLEPLPPRRQLQLLLFVGRELRRRRAQAHRQRQQDRHAGERDAEPEADAVLLDLAEAPPPAHLLHRRDEQLAAPEAEGAANVDDAVGHAPDRGLVALRQRRRQEYVGHVEGQRARRLAPVARHEREQHHREEEAEARDDEQDLVRQQMQHETADNGEKEAPHE